MTPVTHNYKDAVRGDTIPAKQFTITKTVDQVTTPIDLTNVAIKARFVKEGQEIIKEVGSGITFIGDPALGVFEIDVFRLQGVGEYRYDLQFKFSDGTVKTYVKGTINIKEDYTR